MLDPFAHGQELAIGHWRWDLRGGEVAWSPEIIEIYGLVGLEPSEGPGRAGLAAGVFEIKKAGHEARLSPTGRYEGGKTLPPASDEISGRF
ncbi:hypothetical protein [Histidinibacterium lentulum]|uniref:hypothetical protein n=1 Tax=Histidinibacterium lentulum TaxID=2480588 RepID=UPI000F4B00C3|nr:hypothetical protein [Histidinibacterium lentulum]